MDNSTLVYIILIILFVIFIISLLYCNSLNPCSIVEHYEERMGGTSQDPEIEDIYDKEFVDFYEIIYRDPTDSKIVMDAMVTKCLDNVKDKSKIKIMVGGCGVNRTGSLLKKKYENTVCVDISKNMLLKAQQLHPNCKYIHGDLREKNLFKKGEFSHILLDERLLNYNNMDDMKKIINNCNYWLAEQGFLIVPIYNRDKLGLAARFYSTNYIDNKKYLHGFTYLNDFSHDCYYIPLEEITNNQDNTKDIKDIYVYFDKIVLDDEKKRVKKTNFYFPEKDKVYNMIMQQYFKNFYIEPYKDGKQVIGGYEVAIFRKERSKLTVEEIENKYK